MKNKLMTIAILANLAEANRMKNLLDSAGIDCYLPDHELSVENASSYFGEVELQVCENDAASALELIGIASSTDEKDKGPLETIVQLIKKIAVPIDFSPSSLNAAIYATHVAKQKGADITLVHAYFNPVTDPVSYDHFYAFPANVGETLSEIIASAGDLMREFMVKLNGYLTDHQLLSVNIKTEIVGGIAEEAILDFAMEGGFDLVILGVTQRKGSESYFGSFMTEMINQSSIPVLAIPSDTIYKESMFKKMMYATNFEKSDGSAIRKLIGISLPLESHIYIVHIDDTNDNPFINYDLAHFKEKYIGSADLVKMDFDLIVNKNLAKGIEDYIAEKEIDILAVTSHKRNLITSLFMPSLTKELLFRLKIPMLIFHA